MCFKQRLIVFAKFYFKTFILFACHRKYSQSEYMKVASVAWRSSQSGRARKPNARAKRLANMKAVVYLTVLNPTFPSCAAILFRTKFSKRIFYWMGIK